MNYSGYIKNSLLDGEGMRNVLFLSGCNHGCKGCHNKDTWNPNVGDTFDEEMLQKLIEDTNKPHVQGVTLSGGDPLHPRNRVGVLDILVSLNAHSPQADIWLYTGYTYEELLDMNDGQINAILTFTDVLVDGKFVLSLKSKECKFRGSTNQRLIDVTKSRHAGYIVDKETK